MCCFMYQLFKIEGVGRLEIFFTLRYLSMKLIRRMFLVIVFKVLSVLFIYICMYARAFLKRVITFGQYVCLDWKKNISFRSYFVIQ